jgi:hypothetical protein
MCAASPIALSSTHVTANRYPPSHTCSPRPAITTGWYKCPRCALWMRAGTPHSCPMMSVVFWPRSACPHGVPFSLPCPSCGRYP